MHQASDKNKNPNTMIKKIKQKLPWKPIEIVDTESIPKGDMPGDKVNIGPQVIQKAMVIFPKLLDLLIPVLDESPYQRAVVVVCGGSGVGKSGIASLISYYLNNLGLGSYTLSGDNYPHRIPKYNDAERLRVLEKRNRWPYIGGQYSQERLAILKELQESGNDSNKDFISRYPWLSAYQIAGRNGLKIIWEPQMK